MEDGSKKEPARTEILNDLGDKTRRRWERLAASRFREPSEVHLRKAESLGCLAEEEHALQE